MIYSIRYKSAIEAFGDLGGFRDSRQKVEECKEFLYTKAMQLFNNEFYVLSKDILECIPDY